MANTHSKRKQESQKKWFSDKLSVALILVGTAVFVVIVFLLLWTRKPQTISPQETPIQMVSRVINLLENTAEFKVLDVRSLWSNTALIFAVLAIFGAAITKIFDKLWEYSKYFRRNWVDFVQYFGLSLIVLLVLAYLFGLLAERLFHITLPV
jgi:hypothetical protein